MKPIAIAAALVALASCASEKSAPIMNVLYIEGSVHAGIRPDTWEIGEVKYCHPANAGDEFSDMLLCGPQTTIAWETADSFPEGDARKRARLQVAQFTRSFHVSAKNANSKMWICRRSSDGISCE